MEQFQVFMANHPALFAAAGAIIFLLILNEIKLAMRGFRNVEPADAVRLINDGAIVLDFRAAEIYRKAHIINARNIELDALLQDPEKLLRNIEQPVITCCDTGITGRRAATRLATVAKSSVFNLKGGMAAWKRENLPTTKS
ncbi:MAG: rhodanese-like domain-containing protein [Gammaproteobacteria bacterium]